MTLDETLAVVHYFPTEGNPVYMRKMEAPSGSVIGSHKHAYEHYSILCSGYAKAEVGERTWFYHPGDVMVVPAGMKPSASVIVAPSTKLVTLEIEVIWLLPVVVMPLGVTWLEAVAVAEMVMVLEVVPVIVAPPGMPVPVIGWPMVTAVVLDTPVMTLLPEVTTPVGATAAIVPVAACESVMVLGLVVMF